MRSDDEQVEAHFDRHRRRLEEHEAAVAAAHDQQAGSDDRDGGTVGTITGPGQLAALGSMVIVVGTLAWVRRAHVGSDESRRTTSPATDRTRQNSKL